MLSTESLNIVWLFWAVCGLVFLRTVYNLLFHPLQPFPGPWYCKVSRFWYCFQLARGNLYHEVKRLHDIYGEAVRIAPNELSYNSAEAWSSIYGRNIQRDGKSTPSVSGSLFPKDPILYGPVLEGAETLIDAEGNDYTPQKRALALAFTRRSLLTKEDILSSYIDHAIGELTTQVKTKDVVDMIPLFGNALLDLSCKLTVDRDLGAINPHGKPHSTLDLLDQAMKWIYIPVTARRLPRVISYPLETAQRLLVAKGLLHLGKVGPLVLERVEQGGSATDLVSYMNRYQKEDKASKVQLINNATIFINAGTETSTTLLCGAIYYILSNPQVLSKLTEEIRGAVTNIRDLNLDLINSMSYLKACVNESMRIYPPVPGTLTRLTPKGGAYICGNYVPQDTVVGVSHWATYHNAANFKYPEEFRPERWIDIENVQYAGDRRHALQPFSYGPRKCIASE